ncbi:GRP family sugar transporter [Aquiflexum sp.]|uniref:GRP family sugar transporter n=1 Tax=Aquiflexum sp. TaxID=1872584 RepID=UPI0035939189
MVLIQSYSFAIVAFIICMTCWGSWANTQKMAKNFRFELYYWDLILGIVVTAGLAAITLGSLGNEGRTFWEDLGQATTLSILMAILGGIVWNLGNLLLVAGISLTGLAVAFPIGGGIAWVLGICYNLLLEILDRGYSEGQPYVLFTGVLCVVVAIIFSARAYKKLEGPNSRRSSKGIIASVVAGFLIAFFYGFVVQSMDNSYVAGGTGTLTPFTAVFFFSIGALICTVVVNPIFMAYPVDGEPVSMKDFSKATIAEHAAGWMGGFIWMSGMVLSFMAVGAGSPAISYALSNAAPVVAAIWGVFIWKEFKGSGKETKLLLTGMFAFYVVGLVFIVWSKI